MRRTGWPVWLGGQTGHAVVRQVYSMTSSARARIVCGIARPSAFEMSEQALSRALIPFPISVRTLDALHLATMEFIRGRGEMVELASYDNRLLTAAAELGIQAVGL
jgi:hypothetical protein